MAGAALAGLLLYLCLSVVFCGLGWIFGWLIGVTFQCPRSGIIAGVTGSLLGAWLGYIINGINYVPPPPPSARLHAPTRPLLPPARSKATPSPLAPPPKTQFVPPPLATSASKKTAPPPLPSPTPLDTAPNVPPTPPPGPLPIAPYRATPHDGYELDYMFIGAIAGAFVLPLIVVLGRKIWVSRFQPGSAGHR